jgi:RNA polymerase sigma-70 factor (ECF subfamily)
MSCETLKLEADLVAGLLEGNEEAFELLHRRYENRVTALAGRFALSEEDAEEIVQDVFTLVYRKIGRFQGRCALSSWIYRITINCALMKVRSRKRRKVVDLVPLDGDLDREDLLTNIEATVANRKTLAMMRGVIETLPEKYRAVFLMRDVNGMSGRETAEFLGLTESAIKSRLQRARELVKRRFEEHQESETVDGYIWEM